MVRRKEKLGREEKRILRELARRGGRVVGIERFISEVYPNLSSRYLYIAWRRIYNLEKKGLIKIRKQAKKKGYIIELVKK